MKLPLCRPAVLLTTAVATLAVSLPSTALAHPQHSKAKEYSLDQYAVPADLTTGPDGALYAPDGSLDRLWRVTTKGKVSSIPVPGGPAGVATGKDGALWVTARTDDQVHRVTTKGQITSYQLTEGAFPTDIVVGPRRRAVGHRGPWRPDRSRHHQGRGHRVPDPDRRRVRLRHHGRLGRRALVHRVQRRQDRPHHHQGRADRVPGRPRRPARGDRVRP